jgi:hypothetical protein
VSAQRFSLSTFTIDTLTTKRESERENDDAWYYYYFKGKHRKLAPKSDFHLLCPFSNLPRLIRNFKLSICLLCSAAAAARHHLQNGSRIWHQFHGWWCRRRSSNAHHMLFKYTHTRITTTTTKDVTLCAFSIWWMMIEREIISLFVHQNPRRTGHDRNIQQKYPQTQSYSFSQPRFIFKYKVYTIIERDSLYANEGIYVYRRKEIFDSWLIFAFIPIRHLKV